MFMYVTLEAFAFSVFGIPNKMIVVSLFGILGMLLFLMPFIDRKARGGEPSPLLTAIGWFAIAYIAATTAIGYLQ